jgi:hypothetical protein
MSSKVNVKFTILVKGMIGGSFEIDRDVLADLRKRMGPGRRKSHEETDIADELLSHAPFNYFDHLNVDEMEIEEMEEESTP